MSLPNNVVVAGLLILVQTAGGFSSQSTSISKSLRVVGEPHVSDTWSYNVYTLSVVPLALTTLSLAYVTRPKIGDENVPPSFWRFLWRFLAVWSLAVSADWLQGPYVYALYASYGFDSQEIAQLFVVGFAAALIFGVFAGAFADTYGRKRCAMWYCILYITSCATKHSQIFWVLVVGRVTGGFATSLLYSTFESWMVAEVKGRHSFGPALLRYTFSTMYFAQYLVAIFSGLLSQAVVSASPMKAVENSTWKLHYGGNLCPFDVALLVSLVTLPIISFSWEENFGDGTEEQSIMRSFVTACQTMRQRPSVTLLGVVVALFEGTMFAFVFNWTPALESKSVPPPHGLIFSAFMMACMCGSCGFSLIKTGVHTSRVLSVVVLVAAAALLAVFAAQGTSWNLTLSFFAFLVFEACVGMYFPAMGTLKSEVVPEASRMAIYNMYRVPLNSVVLVLLLSNFSLRWAFGTSVVLLVVAFGALQPMVPRTREKSETIVDKGL